MESPMRSRCLEARRGGDRCRHEDSQGYRGFLSLCAPVGTFSPFRRSAGGTQPPGARWRYRGGHFVITSICLVLFAFLTDTSDTFATTATSATTATKIGVSYNCLLCYTLIVSYRATRRILDDDPP